VVTQRSTPLRLTFSLGWLGSVWRSSLLSMVARVGLLYHYCKWARGFLKSELGEPEVCIPHFCSSKEGLSRTSSSNHPSEDNSSCSTLTIKELNLALSFPDSLSPEAGSLSIAALVHLTLLVWSTSERRPNGIRSSLR
jgi:hypothetical protein